MTYEVDGLGIDEFFYRRLRTYLTCTNKTEAIDMAIAVSQKQGTATVFATDDNGIMTCTLFVHGVVQGIDNIGGA